MSRKKRKFEHFSRDMVAPADEPPVAMGEPDTLPTVGDLHLPDTDEPPAYRRCPVCWEQFKGVGKTRSVPTKKGRRKTPTTLRKRYYKCDRCAHGWVATVQPAVVLRIEWRQEL